MSREKMMEAEIALKDEQLADLTEEVERLRRHAEASENLTQSAVENESAVTELKKTIRKLVPAAKKAVQYAAELDETCKRLAIVERERDELSKNYAATCGQAATLKNALAEAQKNVRAFGDERREMAKRARTAETTAKTAAREELVIVIAVVLLCVGTIGGSYAYVKTALAPPAELSDAAASVFKQYAPEFRRVVELAVQNERENIEAERTRLAAERDRYQEFNENTVWDKIALYGWLILLFGGGFVCGAMTIVVVFVFRVR